jgi:hypothetical protein
MARSTDPKKVALWQTRFQRYLESGLSVLRFCAAEDVSESSFYYWLKRLGPLKRRRPAREEDRATRYADYPVRRADRGIRAEDRNGCSEGRGLFRPVTVVPATSGVVVRLPGGTEIEVAAGQLDAIRAVVAETVSVSVSKTATESSSAHWRSPHGLDGAHSC